MVLDELLLMTNNIKLGLEQEPQMPYLSGIYVSRDGFKLDTGAQLSAQDLLFNRPPLIVCVARWFMIYNKGSMIDNITNMKRIHDGYALHCFDRN